ncbi:hypothetical protein ACFVHW_09920 [Streptomyces sp. NPDC127110]|uniref:hypothetical protein n=1 Tax=Streptomyces sp. NPDC127110 TaxID=3345362 RepID=UPI00363C7D25
MPADRLGQVAEQGVGMSPVFDVFRPVRPAGPAGPDPAYATTGPAYGMSRLVDLSVYPAELLAAFSAQDVEVLQLHPEYAPGQFEVSVAPAARSAPPTTSSRTPSSAMSGTARPARWTCTTATPSTSTTGSSLTDVDRAHVEGATDRPLYHRADAGWVADGDEEIPTWVVASERLDADPDWRLLESQQLRAAAQHGPRTHERPSSRA